MFTCTKSYQDIPMAHRQHRHAGHCAYIHGHNWTITLTFACKKLDSNGFVVDFGQLKYIKDWIDRHLDHACLLNEDDPHRSELECHKASLFKFHILPCCSSEGIAQHLFQIFNTMVQSHTQQRVWLSHVDIKEDSKNSASYTDPR
tara:strand:+ start:347 stop:781 length:435 start_codon:yes stop_codon:yes gene_type:complete